jgi:hypothetical protein
MKNLFLSVLALFTMSTVFSQNLSGGNGGQLNFNSNLKIEYLGNGKVLVTNKQAVTGDFKIQDTKHDSTITIVAGGTGIFYLDPSLKTNIYVKGKALTNCGGDCGWVELFIASLPLKYANFKVSRISDTECYVDFDIYEVVNVKEIYIKVSLDGKVFTVASTLKPNQSHYHEYLDVTPFLPKKK